MSLATVPLISSKGQIAVSSGDTQTPFSCVQVADDDSVFLGESNELEQAINRFPLLTLAAMCQQIIQGLLDETGSVQNANTQERP